MSKFRHSITSIALAAGMLSMPLLSADAPAAVAMPAPQQQQTVHMGIVNFRNCVEQSKLGKQERSALEALQGEVQARLETREKELEALAQKLSDPDFVDGLAPKAEEDMRTKFQMLSQEQARDQNQFFQMLNQAHYKIMQTIAGAISRAATTVAQQNKLDVILNEDAAFYYNQTLDVTSLVVIEMDKLFDANQVHSDDLLKMNPATEEMEPAAAPTSGAPALPPKAGK